MMMRCIPLVFALLLLAAASAHGTPRRLTATTGAAAPASSKDTTAAAAATAAAQTNRWVSIKWCNTDPDNGRMCFMFRGHVEKDYFGTLTRKYCNGGWCVACAPVKPWGGGRLNVDGQRDGQRFIAHDTTVYWYWKGSRTSTLAYYDIDGYDLKIEFDCA